MNHNIAIIGAGQLGSRHLQALAYLLQPAQIWITDPSEAALKNAHIRWREVASSEIHKLYFTTDLKQLPKEITVAIVATNSLVRRSIVESLLQQAQVRFLVLEKVLFPALEDYAAVNDLLHTYGTQAWVNCPRRQYPGYQQLKAELSGQAFVMTVSGSTWGLACNSIHWVDIFAYLCGNTSLEIKPLLDQEPFSSKRAGYTEFSGSLLVADKSGSRLLLHCFAAGSHPLEAHLELPSTSFYIQEAQQQITVRTAAANWAGLVQEFPILRQSQLSHLFVTELLQQGYCSLTTYKESMQLHLPLMKVFLAQYNAYHKTPQNTLCPIT